MYGGFVLNANASKQRIFANCLRFLDIRLIPLWFCSAMLGAREFARKRPSRGAPFIEMWWFSGDLWTWFLWLQASRRILAWRWMPHLPKSVDECHFEIWMWCFSWCHVLPWVSHRLAWSAQAQTSYFVSKTIVISNVSVTSNIKQQYATNNKIPVQNKRRTWTASWSLTCARPVLSRTQHTT